MSLEDNAQDQEAAEWARINTGRTTAPAFEPDEKGYGPAICNSCDADMPAERRARGQRICTACQRIAEERARLFRR